MSFVDQGPSKSVSDSKNRRTSKKGPLSFPISSWSSSVSPHFPRQHQGSDSESLGPYESTRGRNKKWKENLCRWIHTQSLRRSFVSTPEPVHRRGEVGGPFLIRSRRDSRENRVHKKVKVPSKTRPWSGRDDYKGDGTPSKYPLNLSRIRDRVPVWDGRDPEAKSQSRHLRREHTDTVVGIPTS